MRTCLNNISMSNGNHLFNYYGNDSEQSFDNLSESYMDERLNKLIAHQPNHHEEIVSTVYCWFLVLLYAWVIYLCWPFIIFAYVAYRLIVYDNSSLPAPYCCGWMRDAQEEERVAFTTDIRFSDTLQMLAPVPLAIQNTQPHDPTILDNLNDPQQTETSTTNQNNEIGIINTHDELNIQTTTDENPNEDNANLHDAIESEDDTHSSDSSDEENDQVPTVGSGADTDDENEPADDIQQQGHASPTASENLPVPVQNNVESNQINTVGGQLNTASLDQPHIQVMETVGRINDATENLRQTILPLNLICSTDTHIPKLRNPPDLSDESSDEQAI